MDQSAAATLEDRTAARRELTDFLCRSVASAREVETPFFHVELDQVFPAPLYARMLAAMPEAADYRPMHGRSKDREAFDRPPTRVKIDLFPEFIRHLPPAKRDVWEVVGAALRSEPLRRAFVRKLAPGLRRRFGDGFERLGLYPIPILTRDTTGYRIHPHPDTHWKGITVQLYLPPDESMAHVGTIFNAREGDRFPEVSRMRFAPNSGYAFAVAEDTWHSADAVEIGAKSRDSILLTYFVDSGALRVLRNRGKRLGNLLLNEVRRVSG